MNVMNLPLMLPEIALTVLGILVILADLAMAKDKRHLLGWWVAAAFGAVAVWLFLRPAPEPAEYAAFGLFRLDAFALFMKKVFALTGILVAVMSVDWVKRHGRGAGEFFTIIVFAMTGMFFVASVNDFMSMFVSLELVTLSFFILAAFRIADRVSGEAGMKYIIVGALAAGFMLFGTAFVYGATGQIRFDLVRDSVDKLPDAAYPTLLFGAVVLLVGLGFKVAAVPFHVWVPDVYQGAPTPVTAFLSVGSKAAGFILMVRVLTLTFGDALSNELMPLFALIAALTLFYGNLAAIPQVNLKRLMGYSSIGHAGYLLLGIVSIVAMQRTGGSIESGVSAIAFYLFAYVFTNMAVFLGIVAFSAVAGRKHAIDDYAGLGKRSPFLALVMTVALLSLAGAPPLSGFFGKFYLVASVVEAASVEGNGWLLVLAGIGAVNVVVSMYYYLCVVKRMYMMEPPADAAPIAYGAPTRIALAACMAMIVIIGIFQGPFVKMAASVVAVIAR